MEKSEFEVAKSLAERDSARQDLIVRVARIYFNILDAIDNIDYTVSEKNAIKSQLEEAKKRFEVGLIAITDLADAQASYDLSVTRTIEAESLSDLRKRVVIYFNRKIIQ